MRNKQYFCFFLIVFCLFIIFLHSQKPSFLTKKIIAPNQKHIKYTGRIDFSNSLAPILFWSGTSIEVLFEGQDIRVILDDQLGLNYFNAIIDDDFEHPIIISCQKGEKIYPIIAGLDYKVHKLTLFKRTESRLGSTVFRGFILSKRNQIKEFLPRHKRRRIEFYGDSITCGKANEAPENGNEHNPLYENNFLSYAALTARYLDAEYVCIAKSGIGLIKSWGTDPTLPEIYDRLNSEDRYKKWDFSKWIPDIVVINVLQNDHWLLPQFYPTLPAESIVQAYVDFIEDLRSKYSQAYIICTLGCMDAVKENAPWRHYIEEAVLFYSKQNNDHKIYTYFFDYNEKNQHPRVEIHQKMSQELFEFIKKKHSFRMKYFIH